MDTAEQDTNQAGALPTTSSDSLSKPSRMIRLWTTLSRDQNSEHTLPSPNISCHRQSPYYTIYWPHLQYFRVHKPDYGFVLILYRATRKATRGACYYFPNILDMNPFFFLSSDGCLLEPVEEWLCTVEIEAGIVDDFLLPNPCFRFL